ncbi:hypothetical protein CN598_12710 [Bacillus wiedmannii]|nr:hypothetical protein CN598_12710 [Bacillus wiedmannii]
MILCRVLTPTSHTEVIPLGSEAAIEHFKREVATQSNPESFFYSWERPVRVKNIVEIVSIEEEN